MIISLPPELEAFAHRQVENGKYGSIEALLAAGVRALIDRDDSTLNNLRLELLDLFDRQASDLSDRL